MRRQAVTPNLPNVATAVKCSQREGSSNLGGPLDKPKQVRKFALFRRFDPRLAAELRRQRVPILIGLACTTVTSALYTSTIGLTKLAFGDLEKISANTPGKLLNGIQKEKLDLSSLQQAALLKQGALAQEVALNHLILVSLGVVAVFGLRYFFTRGQVYFLSEAANKLAADLRIRMFNKLMRLPVTYFNDRRTGAIQSVLTNDVTVYQTAVGIIRSSVDGPIKAVGAFFTLVVIQWKLALIGVIVIPIMVAIIQRNARRMRVAQSAVQEDLAEVSATTQETLLGTRVVKAFGAEKRTSNLYEELIARTLHSQMRAVAITASLQPLVELIGALALAVLLYCGGTLAMRGNLESSDIIAMAFAMEVINQGCRSMANVSNTFAGVQAASDRIHGEILGLPDAPDAQGSLTIAHPTGQLEFRNVTFAYPDGTPALRDVSFRLEAGHSLALVGPSGAGKSTIADLILRFYEPTAGQILLDGVDIATLDVNWLRAQTGIVPQHTFLFAGSIEDNVRLGAPNATENEVNEALRMAYAEGFAKEMNERESALLGERGVRLSGGQMQRVAIARALVRKPTLLILDEATSALDAASEKVVTEALDEVMHERTTLFIAHRLTTAARADRILVLSKGEVVEQGSHAELIQANGAYAGLFRAFSGGIIG